MPFARLPISPERLLSPIHRSVLLVDDDRNWLEMLSRLMQLEGFEVSTASNAPAALRMLRDAPVDLIVSDLHMSRMDGLEMRNELLRRNGRPIPFIFVSALRDDESIAVASSLGVSHFLEKGGPIEELVLLAHSIAG